MILLGLFNYLKLVIGNKYPAIPNAPSIYYEWYKQCNAIPQPWEKPDIISLFLLLIFYLLLS